MLMHKFYKVLDAKHHGFACDSLAIYSYFRTIFIHQLLALVKGLSHIKLFIFI